VQLFWIISQIIYDNASSLSVIDTLRRYAKYGFIFGNNLIELIGINYTLNKA